MARLHRILVGLSMILLVSGAAGVATHGVWRAGAAGRIPGSGPGPGPTSGAGTTSTTASNPPRTSLPAGPPGPSSAVLAGGLVTPTDMGGYYRVVPDFAAALISSSSCLAGLQAAAQQSGRALTALLGPDEYSVPSIVEEVASYPGSSARSHFAAATAAIGGCAGLSFDFGGPAVTARLAGGSVPPVGDADRVWSGSFTMGSASFSIQIGTVLDSDEVLTLIWIDTVPASDPIMGSFVSTLSLAIGKLA